jgi:hypothetical protein
VKKGPSSPAQVLLVSKQEADKMVARIGTQATTKVLAKAEKELSERLRSSLSGSDTFTRKQMEATLVQMRQTLRALNPRFKDTLVNGADEMAKLGADGTAKYLEAADAQFRGVGQQPLALDTSSMFDAAQQGTNASILRRLTEGIPGPNGTKVGILQRYDENVIGDFEATLQQGVLQKMSIADMRDLIVLRKRQRPRHIDNPVGQRAG